jgi:hypothetical protein
LVFLNENSSTIESQQHILNLLLGERSVSARSFAWQQHDLLLSGELSLEKQELALTCSVALFQNLEEREWDRFWQSTQHNDNLRKRYLSR